MHKAPSLIPTPLLPAHPPQDELMPVCTREVAVTVQCKLRALSRAEKMQLEKQKKAACNSFSPMQAVFCYINTVSQECSWVW